MAHTHTLYTHTLTHTHPHTHTRARTHTHTTRIGENMSLCVCEWEYNKASQQREDVGLTSSNIPTNCNVQSHPPDILLPGLNLDPTWGEVNTTGVGVYLYMAIYCTHKVTFCEYITVYMSCSRYFISHFYYMHKHLKTSAPREKKLLHHRSSKPRKDRSSTTGKPKTVALWGSDGRATGMILEVLSKWIEQIIKCHSMSFCNSYKVRSYIDIS